MEFLDDGIVLASRPHGENHAVVDILMQSRGRWTALVHGGQGRRMLPVLQPGNDVRVQWR
ncbi:MAG: recombination protein O N-terminal domain-containing protein, partial [Parvularculaceae bacterium]|nr:recombination protein O N-terminal domain-containing protein [Parvularculaceae bacterium]